MESNELEEAKINVLKWTICNMAVCFASIVAAMYLLTRKRRVDEALALALALALAFGTAAPPVASDNSAMGRVLQTEPRNAAMTTPSSLQ